MKPTKTKKRIGWEKLNELFAKENEQKFQNELKELMKPTKTKEEQLRLIRLLNKTKSQIETLISELSKENI